MYLMIDDEGGCCVVVVLSSRCVGIRFTTTSCARHGLSFVQVLNVESYHKDWLARCCDRRYQ